MFDDEDACNVQRTRGRGGGKERIISRTTRYDGG